MLNVTQTHLEPKHRSLCKTRQRHNHTPAAEQQKIKPPNAKMKNNLAQQDAQTQQGMLSHMQKTQVHTTPYVHTQKHRHIQPESKRNQSHTSCEIILRHVCNQVLHDAETICAIKPGCKLANKHLRNRPENMFKPCAHHLIYTFCFTASKSSPQCISPPAYFLFFLSICSSTCTPILILLLSCAMPIYPSMSQSFHLAVDQPGYLSNCLAPRANERCDYQSKIRNWIYLRTYLPNPT